MRRAYVVLSVGDGESSGVSGSDILARVLRVMELMLYAYDRGSNM